MSYKIMQIETSNICSLTCEYCPHPSQKRPKSIMDFDTFKLCIEAVKRSSNAITRGKKFVWLNHFGEPLLNPRLPQFVSYATSEGVDVSFASNGVDHDKQLFPREMWRELAEAGLKRVSLSAHVKSRNTLLSHIGDIVEVAGLWNPEPQNIHNWAGQVNVERFRASGTPIHVDRPCDYEIHHMFAVRWDGMLASCCYDIEGGVGMHISEVLEHGFLFRKIDLCGGCTLGRGDVSWIDETDSE